MTKNLSLLNQCLQRTLPMGHIALTDLPNVPEIRLALINDSFPTGPLPQEVMQAVIAQPAYWAFCWGSGLALARYILDNPHWVKGKHVVDLGSGSGIAGIAAALAGAKQVVACDTDADAQLATQVNAELNNVVLEVTPQLPQHTDILLMADVLYDRQNLPLLDLAQAHAEDILVADSRVTVLPDPHYIELTTIGALTYPNLGEFDEFGTAHLFHWQNRQRDSKGASKV